MVLQMEENNCFCLCLGGGAIGEAAGCVSPPLKYGGLKVVGEGWRGEGDDDSRGDGEKAMFGFASLKDWGGLSMDGCSMECNSVTPSTDEFNDCA